jgi:DNA repair photolyase
MDLFQDDISATQPDRVGKTKVTYAAASGILTKATGFMSGYDYTLNPYSGCSFGCTYCYAAFFIRDEALMNDWGNWVKVKQNALALLRRKRKKPLTDVTIYMSSVTDPYQPVEAQLELTRSLLKELADYHQPRLVIQTRSKLVTRDIDILSRFEKVQVNMTVTTDSEEVRKAFEPDCPKLSVRLKAIKEVHDAGISACITMTPLLPVINAEQFAADLRATGIQKFIVQPFHADRGRFVAGTRETALSLIKQLDWNQKKFDHVHSILANRLPNLGYGRDGFTPI